jgi:hypothetical protein
VDTTLEPVERAVAHQILLGFRESLTIAGQIGQSIELVNAALERLQGACDGCIVLTQPYVGEPRVVITVVQWDALKNAAGFTSRLR